MSATLLAGIGAIAWIVVAVLAMTVARAAAQGDRRDLQGGAPAAAGTRDGPERRASSRPWASLASDPRARERLAVEVEIAQRGIDAAREEVARAERTRDGLVRWALANGLDVPGIAEATGLSRDEVRRLVA